MIKKIGHPQGKIINLIMIGLINLLVILTAVYLYARHHENKPIEGSNQDQQKQYKQ